MKKKDRRFEIIYTETAGLDGTNQILLDKETGVNYLIRSTGYASSITPLINADGNPIITKPEFDM